MGEMAASYLIGYPYDMLESLGHIFTKTKFNHKDQNILNETMMASSQNMHAIYRAFVLFVPGLKQGVAARHHMIPSLVMHADICDICACRCG